MANDKQIKHARDALLAAAACARRCRDSALLAEVALEADGPWADGSILQPDALSLLEEALPGIDPSDHGRLVRVLTGIASDVYYTDHDRQGRLANEALAIAQQVDDPETLAAALLAVHLWESHRPEARSERLTRSRARPTTSRRSRPRRADYGCALTARSSSTSSRTGRSQSSGAGSTAYEQLAYSLGSPRDMYSSMVLQATAANLHGDLAAGEQLARGAALRGRELEQLSEGAYFLQRFVARYQQGRLSEEVGNLEPAGEAQTVFLAGAALAATAYAETGQADRAISITRHVLGPEGSGLPLDAFWLGGAALFAGVAAAAGAVDLITLLYALLEGCADHVVIFGAGGAVLGSGHHWLGVLAAASGQTDAAIDHLAEATSIARRLDAPYWIAASSIEGAAALRARDRADDASRVRIVSLPKRSRSPNYTATDGWSPGPRVLR